MTARKAFLPRKAQGLHVQELDGEFVVVDESTQSAHALRGVNADVWRAIEAGAVPNLSTEAVDTAVSELRELGLLEQAGVHGRRALLQRAGTVAVAGAVITIGLPAANAAASGNAAAVFTPTATSLSSSPSSPAQGSAYDITATVAPALASGTVTLTNTTPGSTAAPRTATVSGNAATFRVLASGAANRESFRAEYSGDNTHGPSADTATFTYRTSATLEHSAFIPLAATPYTMIVTVAGASGFGSGTGEVHVTTTASDVAVAAANQRVDSNGQVRFAITNPVARGVLVEFHFTYTGDSHYTVSGPDNVSYRTI